MSDEEEEESKPEKKLVGVRVTEERRQRWKEQVEESNKVNSMAQAMRMGFEQLFDEESGGGMKTERVIERIDKLEQEVQENREQIERIPYNYPSLEEISEEVVYRLGELGEEKQGERRY